MNQPLSLKMLAAHVSGHRQAMEAVMHGVTPDHAKWTGVNSFVRAYSKFATQYATLTGDKSVNLYDASKLKNPFDTVWPAQKSMFDTIYADTLILSNLLSVTEVAPTGPLYNLFVSGFENEWAGEPFMIELSRSIREYTAPHLTNRYGDLSAAAIAELKRAPCIFAYEAGRHTQAPKFGYIREIANRQGQVRVEYELYAVDPFLTADDLTGLMFELDIDKLELYRTHWAVKEVNLPKELHAHGITLPSTLRDVTNAVDVSTHIFDVALSFPGEKRPLVEHIAQELERGLGPNTYFYDSNYVSQLAQPSLDTLLQDIYRRAKLVVVFLGSDYQRKDWCGVEFRAVREIILSRENSRVMFIRTDDGEVEGVFKTDGYIDAREFNAAKIAEFIHQRLDLLARGKPTR
jgi:TIR domain